MWIFKDDETGITYDKAYINGYSFGDRLLEDVMFEITIDENNQFHAQFASPDGYTIGLNEAYWCEAAREYATTNDIFYSGLSHHSSDITVFDTETDNYCPNVVL